jgi:hypothetical protein
MKFQNKKPADLRSTPRQYSRSSSVWVQFLSVAVITAIALYAWASFHGV